MDEQRTTEHGPRHSRVRRTLAGLAAATLVGGGWVALGVPHGAASADTSAPGVVHRAGRIARVTSYWTAARMRAAIPVDPIAADSGQARGRAGARVSTTTANMHRSSPSTARVPTSVGKLFFTDRGTDYVCSASAIATKSRNQVLTAGHCVHTGPHPEDGLLGSLFPHPRYFSNWVFVPRYVNGSAPFGKWVATHHYVADGWVKNESFAQDQAILTVARRNKRRLTDVVGGNPVALGKGAHQLGVRIWGWPAETPFTGEVAWRCDGTTRPTNEASAGDAAMGCGLNGGASGGPWMLKKGRTANAGTIFAVTSRITTTGREIVLAHPLPRSLRKLINAAGG